jgi:hypothetical protein
MSPTRTKSTAMSPTIQEESKQAQAAAAERLPADVVATFTGDREAIAHRTLPKPSPRRTSED